MLCSQNLCSVIISYSARCTNTFSSAPTTAATSNGCGSVETPTASTKAT